MTGTDEEGGAVATAEAVPGNGGPRSAGTRRAILEAARSAFAAHGYDQATIRSVAATAGVDPSMVMRYFGSKAGLFTAASTTRLQPPDLSAVPAGQRGDVRSPVTGLPECLRPTSVRRRPSLLGVRAHAVSTARESP